MTIRILCLHGAGTSATIFARQLAALQHYLRDDSIDFEFIEGEWDAPAAPGIAKLYPGPYRSFYDWNPTDPSPPADSLADAYDYLSEVLGETPCDGVLGFSQGAALAASYILHHQDRGREVGHTEPVLRFAVFMCGTLPWEKSGKRRIGPGDLSRDGLRPIDIPTLHIHGAADEWVPESRKLKDMCKTSEAIVWEHPVGHTIPVDRKSTSRLGDMLRDVIRRATSKQ